MTFDLSAEEKSLQDRARAVAVEQIAPYAEGIDRTGVIAESVRALMEGTALAVPKSASETAIAVEEYAVISAAVAAVVGLTSVSAANVWIGAADAESPGLRGLGAIDEPMKTLSPQQLAKAHVVLAAVAVGIGHAALDEALTFMRASGDRPSGTPDERPHWILADAAAELDGARLLLQKAAQAVDSGEGQADASLAKMFAAEVAQRTVDAALRILGTAGYRRGTVTERLTRDARAIALVGGTGEEHRAFVADVTFPA